MSKLLSLFIDRKDRVEGLDLMRAFAILLVLFYHAWIFIAPFFKSVGLLFFMGYWGVELFFVLSGFLVGGAFVRVYLKTDQLIPNTIVQFWKRRWIRTIPIYLICLFINYLVLTQIVGLDIKFPFRYFLFVQNLTDPHPSFFPESWSLSIEEWFYVLFPLFFLFRKIEKSFEAIAFNIVLLIVTFTFIRGLNVDVLNFDLIAWDSSVRKVVMNRLDSILYGVLMYVFITFKLEYFKKLRYHFFALGIILCVLSYWAFYLKINALFNQVFFISSTSLSFSLMLPFFYYFKFRWNLIKDIVLFISLISYSLYLTHYTLVFRLMNTYIIANTVSKSILLTSVYIILSVVVASLFYLLVEKKFINLKNNIK